MHIMRQFQSPLVRSFPRCAQSPFIRAIFSRAADFCSLCKIKFHAQRKFISCGVVVGSGSFIAFVINRVLSSNAFQWIIIRSIHGCKSPIASR